MMTRLFLIFSIINCFHLHGQDSVRVKKFFTFQYDNDFFSATDRYYTQGVMVTLSHPIFRRSPLSYTLIRLNKKAINQFALQLRQDVFTPRSIRYMEGAIYYGERPFTATFLISHQLRSVDLSNNLSLSTNLDLGIIGPYAKGEEEQKGIHRALVNIQPQGWENQLSHDYIVNYGAELNKLLLQKKHFNLSGLAGARLGTLYTDARAGVEIMSGITDGRFGNIINEEKNKSLIYVSAKCNVKAVGYNATLQGGATATNIYELPDSSIKRIVGEAGVGITVRIKKLTLEYRKVYLTPEFYGGLSHSWGSCIITVSF